MVWFNGYMKVINPKPSLSSSITSTAASTFANAYAVKQVNDKIDAVTEQEFSATLTSNVQSVNMTLDNNGKPLNFTKRFCVLFSGGVGNSASATSAYLIINGLSGFTVDLNNYYYTTTTARNNGLVANAYKERSQIAWDLNINNGIIQGILFRGYNADDGTPNTATSGVGFVYETPQNNVISLLLTSNSSSVLLKSGSSITVRGI